jgi:hypothetical protein
MQIWSDNCPQGYSYRLAGEPKRIFVDFEGIALILYKNQKPDKNGMQP